MYRNASVRVKFHGSDNYCHFPSDHVTRDTFGETCPKGVPNNEFDVIERDPNGTLLDTKCPADDLATAEPHTRTPLRVCIVADDVPSCNWAVLSEKDLDHALLSITTVEELSGVANRRRVLNHDFKKWSELQKCLILSRKFILENEK